MFTMTMSITEILGSEEEILFERKVSLSSDKGLRDTGNYSAGN